MKINAWLMPGFVAVTLLIGGNVWADRTLLNVSYDPTRELYQEFSCAFAKQRESNRQGKKVSVKQSLRFGQACALCIDGLELIRESCFGQRH